jgi:hypothetical protein
MTGPVNIFACAHICMNVPNAWVMETCRALYGPGGWYKDVIEPNLKVKDGYLLAPEGPGLGTKLRKAVFDRPDVSVESSDTVGKAPHWGGLQSPVFEVVGRPGERKVQYRKTWV